MFNANFNCAATDPLDSIDSFFGTDDEGNQIASGAPIDTVDPGAHSLEVDCYSAAGGGDVSQTINYKVGSYTLTAVKTTKTDQVSFKSARTGRQDRGRGDRRQEGHRHDQVTVASRKTASVTVKPTTAGKKVLAATKGKTRHVQLHVAFTPQAIGTGDSEISPAAGDRRDQEPEAPDRPSGEEGQGCEEERDQEEVAPGGGRPLAAPTQELW